MQEMLYLPPALGVLGLIIAFVIYGVVKKYPEGDSAIKKISDAIHTGAMTFMHREYKMLAIFAGILLIILWVSPLGANTALAFAVGAISSALAGYIGMYTATKANVRTT